MPRQHLSPAVEWQRSQQRYSLFFLLAIIFSRKTACMVARTTLLTKDFAAFGLSYDFIDGDNPTSWKQKLRPNTKAIYVESMSNPLLQVGDLKAITWFAKEHDLISIIDNTFASPVNFRPLDWGFDLSLHSATKYLNGHSDIVAGVVLGRAESRDQDYAQTQSPRRIA